MKGSVKPNMKSSEQFTIGNSKNPGPKSTMPPAQPLLTKELAVALGVSPRFIYQMRACGFPMHGATRRRQMATVEDARDWIRANNFRLLDGKGVTDPGRAVVARRPKSKR